MIQHPHAAPPRDVIAEGRYDPRGVASHALTAAELAARNALRQPPPPLAEDEAATMRERVARARSRAELEALSRELYARSR